MVQWNKNDQRIANPVDRAVPDASLSRQLLAQAQISYHEACTAEHTARRRGLPLAEIYARCYGVSQLTLANMQAISMDAQLINPLDQPSETSLVTRFGPEKCLQYGLLPWRRIGGATIILTARPDEFKNHHTTLTNLFGTIRMAITTEDQLARFVSHLCTAKLVHNAETKVAPAESCRNWNPRLVLFIGFSIVAALATIAFLAPRSVLAVLTGWVILMLILNTMLKATTTYLVWRQEPDPLQMVTPARLPVITMLVPLYKETAISDHLLARLKRLDYPRELLDVCIVLEADDLTTRTTLGKTILPTWMRPIIVPKGTIKTKPRAMNYALDFARGSIIGIWDAEDSPEPDQLHKVAFAFANHGPDVACLQGMLDYYNATANWLTRCFTVEYASWFRVTLPGFSRLGLVVPLGGTTLFFRREALDQLGGWDAHNVTEDADLGVRLARHGYRTALIHTVTEEEANGRAWPWVKQRSRWLKGYAMTYGVHMRNPARLWRDLEGKRFMGLQLLFLGTLSQFVLAPFLWTFWLLPFGITHPLSAVIPSWAFWSLAGIFVLSELVGLAAAIVGLRKAGKVGLAGWALTLQFYFPLAALAAYKGLYELATKPFYWDKTAHGVLLPQDWRRQLTRPPQQPLHPVSDE